MLLSLNLRITSFCLRVYIPCIYILNKIDQISIEVNNGLFFHVVLSN